MFHHGVAANWTDTVTCSGDIEGSRIISLDWTHVCPRKEQNRQSRDSWGRTGLGSCETDLEQRLRVGSSVQCKALWRRRKSPRRRWEGQGSRTPNTRYSYRQSPLGPWNLMVLKQDPESKNLWSSSSEACRPLGRNRLWKEYLGNVICCIVLSVLFETGFHYKPVYPPLYKPG